MNEEDISKLGKLTKDLKFTVSGNDLIYTNDPIKKLTSFINSYRYILSLKNNVSEQVIAQRIEKYLKSIEKYYNEAIVLESKYILCGEFARYTITKQISNFNLRNISNVQKIVDFVIPLGKVIKLYNPSESVGYS